MAMTQLQLVGSKGDFNREGLCTFVERVGLRKAGQGYVVVAIMGPQSSGKSTVMNHLFKTEFKVMDATKGISQTTQGAWLGLADEGLWPLTLVMDLEGADGRERGENDTLFERQGALFVLAVADIVMYNIWCHDIGRVHAFGTPMLKTIFVEMMRMKLTSRKKKFLFVIRDKTNTPEKKLRTDLQEGMEKIWDALPKPKEHEQKPLSAFFDVEVAVLPNFLNQPDQWEESVKKLRGLFAELIPNALNDGGRVPGDAFSFSTETLWDKIQDNKELDIPSHRTMVASVRCEQILIEKYERFQSDERLLSLKKHVETGDVGGFGKTVEALVDEHLGSFSFETDHYDKEVRTSKFDALRSKFRAHLRPDQKSVIKYRGKVAFSNFKQRLDPYLGLNGGERLETYSDRLATAMLVQIDDDAKAVLTNQWDSDWEQYLSQKKQKLSLRSRKCVQDFRDKKLEEVSNKSKTNLESALAEHITSLLGDGTDQTWSAISNLYKTETKKAITDWEKAASSMDPTQKEMESTQELLRGHGEGIVRQKALKAGADRHVLRLMEKSFEKTLNFYEDGQQRQYINSFGMKSGMCEVIYEAKTAAMTVLSVLAVVRLKDETGVDEVYEALKALVGVVPQSTFARFKRVIFSDDGRSSEAARKKVLSTAVSKNRWENVSDVDTLLTPSKCKKLWQSFQEQSNFHIQKATKIQQEQSAASLKRVKYRVYAGSAIVATVAWAMA